MNIWTFLRIAALVFLIYSFVSADELVLKKEVAVSSKFVNLLDLVQINPQTLSAFPNLKNVYLGKAPEDSDFRIITAQEVRKELEWRGLDKSLTITGEKVTVTKIKTESVYICQILKDAILDLLAVERRLSKESFEVEVSYFNCDEFKGCVLINSVERTDSNWLGTIKFAVDFMTSEGDGKAEVMADVGVRQPICIAKRNIMRGEVLKDSDIEVKNVALKGQEKYFENACELAGANALKDISAGTFITPGAVNVFKPKVESPLVVRAYTQVRARGKYSVVDARALMDGHLGEIIPIEILSTKFQTKAQVLSKEIVEIVSEEKK